MSHRQQQAAFRRTSTLNLLLGALALGAATLAPLAQAGELDAGPVAHSTASRDQVRAEWERALKQRNALLKQMHGRPDESALITLDVWDQKLSTAGDAPRSGRRRTRPGGVTRSASAAATSPGAPTEPTGPSSKRSRGRSTRTSA